MDTIHSHQKAKRQKVKASEEMDVPVLPADGSHIHTEPLQELYLSTHTDAAEESRSPPSSSSSPSVTHSTTQMPQSNSADSVRDIMLVRVITMLEEIQKTQREHGRMLQTLMRQRDVSGTIPSLPEGANFPLKSVSEVQDLELKLADADFKNDVVLVLGDIGGKNIDECTRRTMAFLMSNNLALCYNLMGRHGKREFQSLHLFDAVHAALKKNPHVKDITKKDVERAVAKWFTNARDRDGNRALRAQRDLQRRAAESLVS